MKSYAETVDAGRSYAEKEKQMSGATDRHIFLDKVGTDMENIQRELEKLLYAIRLTRD